jgi:hypothetical protein
VESKWQQQQKGGRLEDNVEYSNIRIALQVTADSALR